MKQESNDAIIAGLLNDILNLTWEAFTNSTSYLRRRINKVTLSQAKQNLHNIWLFVKHSAPSAPSASVCVSLLRAVNLTRYGNLPAPNRSFFKTSMHQQMVMKCSAALSRQRCVCSGYVVTAFRCINISKWAWQNHKHTQLMWAKVW